MLRLDHLAVTAATLEDGVAAVEAALDVAMAGGGQHPQMGTHNRLLGLGDCYLEVIAPDPAAPRPAWPRWFDIDRFTGPPRLTNWIAASEDLATDLALSPPGTGAPLALQRGDYRWQMAVPADGRLPFDGGFPALIEWEGQQHPTRALPDAGVRLTRLEIVHPAADALADALATRIADPRIVITPGSAKAMRATFSTPQGNRSFG